MAGVRVLLTLIAVPCRGGEQMGNEEQSEPDDRSRRHFCATACQVVSTVALGTLVQGCGGGGSPTSPGTPSVLAVVNGSVSGPTITVLVDAASPIAAVGGAAQVTSAAGLFLVTRTSAETFIALTAQCTHEACEVIGLSGQTFVCPCHGSRFTSSGAVLNGPATRPLRQFGTQFSDNVLTISL